MPIIDLTQPLITMLFVAAIICAIYLGYELKRAIIPAIALFICVVLLVVHSLQLFVFGSSYVGYESILSASMIYDFGLVVISYLAYLWIDDVEAKHRNKKSIDNSLEWFWSKI